MAKRRIADGQLPLGFMLPESTWTVPSELPDLRNDGPDLGVDTETRDDGLRAGRGAGWAYGAGYLVGVSMASEHRSVYVPIRHPETANHDEDAVRRWVEDHMRSPQRKIFQNAMYDLGWFRSQWEIEPPEKLDDTIGMGFILDENRLTYSLDALCRWQGVPGKDEEGLRAAAEAYGFDPKADLWRLPAKYVGPYAEQDAASLLPLARTMREKLRDDNLEEAYQLEMDILPLCLEMRRRGIRVASDQVEVVANKLRGRANKALARLSELGAIGRQWEIGDIRSSSFLARMFDAAKIPYPKTAKGNDSFSKDWMRVHDHWLPQLVSEALQFWDAADKFAEGFVGEFAHMGRIHAEIHQFRDDRGGTITTRFSYSNPPLQQMPSRDPVIAPIIRGLFLPEPGQIWATVDYSQQEYRLMVHYASLLGLAGADRAVSKYQNDPDTDFHSLVAELTGLERRRAKDVNFAKAYGAGPAKFSLMTGLSLDESKSVMGQYDEEMPFIARLSEFCQNRADRKGFIRMLDGARGRFNRWEPRWIEWDKVREAQSIAKAEGRELGIAPCELEEARERVADARHPWYGARLRRAFTHKSLNKLIQGSAARQTKMAMRALWRAGIIPMLQMHDDLNFSVDNPDTAEKASEIMREVVKLEVPMKCDVEYGITWGRAAKVKRKDGTVEYGATWEEAIQEL